MLFFKRNLALVPILSGLVIGAIASILVFNGNPGNMGMCVACFTRDTVGALGFHRAAAVQYIRPEILGLILGSFIIALLSKEFRPRAGSSPLIRFTLGAFSMIGALIFLGCPWRAYLRLAGGDLNAIFGILGLITGIVIGVYFLKRGFTLGRNRQTYKFAGYVMPILSITLLALLISSTVLSAGFSSQVFFSKSGPGSLHAAIVISIAAGLIIGLLAQRSRFCTIGAIRDTVILRDTHLLQGVIAFILSAFLTNIMLGQFNLGFANQPISHTDSLWNYLGMVLSGLAFTLAGGCPGRQLILSGEGDTDAAIFIFGMAAGAAICHNFNLASSGAGITAYAPYALVIGMFFCILVGLTMREKL